MAVVRPTGRPARPRIVDVAARAGVSAQTVSNVINGRGGFNEETRARVAAAIEELGFQPNRYAQSLRWRRTHLLGFDMSGQQLDVTNPFAVSFLRSLVKAASGHDYRIVAFTHEAHGNDEFRATVAAGAVDGFVLSDAPVEDSRARILTEARMPFVVFGRTATDLPQTWVDIDNRLAMRPAVDHLVARGHRSFGWVGYTNDEYWNRERFEGAKTRLRDAGFDLDPQAVLIGRPGEVRPRLRALLTSNHRPTAILTSSDSIAVQVVNTASALGLHVGSDLAVTGFDAGPLRTMVEPNLTSVRIPVDRIAVALVDRLMKELAGHRIEGGDIVPTDLVVGDSA